MIVLAFTLSGCYESDIPLASSKNSTVDMNLVGKWKGIGIEDDVTANMIILKFNNNEYYVKHQVEEKKNNGSFISVDSIRFRAYIVMVDRVPFINAQYINAREKDKRRFLFFKYSLSKEGVLTLKMISSKFVKTKFKDSKKLYEFIKKNMNNEKLYEKTVKFTKVAEN